MTTLIATLPLPGAPERELSYCLVSNGQTVSSYGQAAVGLLPRADETVLLLPSQSLSWHPVNLPKVARSISAPKLRAVVDGLVEELVLDDTADLHIALYRPKTTAQAGKAWLAACNKAWLAEHLQAIQAAGQRVSQIIAAAYPQSIADTNETPTEPTLHAMPARAHVSGSPETAVFTLVDTRGVVSVPLAHAKLVWADMPQGEALLVTCEPAVAALAEATLNTKVSVVQSAQVALQALLGARNDGVDLAQGQFALSGSDRWMQQLAHTARNVVSAPAWRVARVGAVVLALAQLIGLNAWAWKERTSLDNKRQQITQLLTQTFPQVKVVVDAPVQMQRELALLRQSSGSLAHKDVESLLAKFFSAATAASAPTAIDYASGELALKGLGLSATQLSELQPKLRSLGMTARSDADKVVVSELPAAPPAGLKP